LLRRAFGPRLFLTPSGSLYRWLLPQLHACALERVLGKWVQATTSAEASEPLALDGKVLRGSGAGGGEQRQVLSVSTHQTGETLIQVAIASKTNEITVAQELLGWLPIAHRPEGSDGET